ncbi:hypothetical protein U5922_012715 [Aquicoccus sp. G2-2]|nr:hypothetical protein [Aquicoccus sp. G2-2]MEA1114275.1 hypothetical protein [Aquicoccus sp. G2-2]
MARAFLLTALIVIAFGLQRSQAEGTACAVLRPAPEVAVLPL